jgi:hypothetical protein
MSDFDRYESFSCWGMFHTGYIALIGLMIVRKEWLNLMDNI